MLLTTKEREEIGYALGHCNFSEENLFNQDEEEQEKEYMNYYINIFEVFEKYYHRPCYCEHGASKIAIIIPSLEIVIKIPFVGDTFQEYYLSGCEQACDDWNYCQKELELYEKALQEGLGDCFARVERFGSVMGHPVYIQEMADIFDHDYDNSHSNHSQEDEDYGVECVEKYKTGFLLNREWMGDAVSYFGSGIFEKLFNFIKQNNITDLSPSNIGYVKNRAVLVDFSSFNG